jgi:hypothetical protein
MSYKNLAAERIGLVILLSTICLAAPGAVASGPAAGAAASNIPQTAILAPFAQIFTNIQNGAISILLAWPGAQVVRQITSNGHLLLMGGYPLDMAVVETPNGGFAAAWGNAGAIEVVLLDKGGNVVRPVTQLFAPAWACGAPSQASHCLMPPALAVTPDGHIAIAWLSLQGIGTNIPAFSYSDVYFAILNQDGTLKFGPTWIDGGSAILPCPGASAVYRPRLAATADNHFVLAWERGVSVSADPGCPTLNDIYIIRGNSDGTGFTAPAKLTEATAAHSFRSPTLTEMVPTRC